METQVPDTVARLSDLPTEVLGIIYRPLGLKDRMRLSSTCCSLWRNLASSEDAWGTLDIERWSHDNILSLLSWLAHRRRGLQRLQLNCSSVPGGDAPQAAAQLAACLEGSPLVRLKLYNLELGLTGKQGSTGLQPLGSCTALTSLALEDCGLLCLPGALELLPSLTELSLARNYRLSGASWGQLRQMTALTRLDLSSCRLPRLPAELAALPSLGELSLARNDLEGASWGPLQQLTALTRLDISKCDLAALPAELAALPALAELSLAENKLGGVDWSPLQQLTALTRLDISWCELAALPAELAVLPSLAELDLHYNKGLRAAAEEAWATLALCSSLTWLCLKDIPFARLPAALASLAPCLVDLNLACTSYFSIDGLWASDEAALGPLLSLTRLTRLVLCSYTREVGIPLPEQLSRLVALRDLELSCRDSRHPRESLRPLWHLTALTRLHLEYWDIHKVPEELSHLQALEHLGFRINLRACEDVGWQPLGMLTALTRLDLSHCHVKRLPPVLKELCSLAHLDLGYNYHLVRGESAACIAANWAALEHLSALTRLDARNCDLDAVPAAFAALPELRVLDLPDNRLLGSAGVAALRPLTRMTGLHHLDLRDCYLPEELEVDAIPFPLHRLEGWAESLQDRITKMNLNRWRSGPL